jgi:hypothetical protein
MLITLCMLRLYINTTSKTINVSMNTTWSQKDAQRQFTGLISFVIRYFYTTLLHIKKNKKNVNICSVLFQQSRLQQLIIDRCDRYICGLSIFSIIVYNIGFSRTAVYNTYLHRLVEKSYTNRTCVFVSHNGGKQYK